jgi:predicted transposase YbfD/YdcC
MKHFADWPDPRQASGQRHLWGEILAISIGAVMCGAEEWSAIEEFGQAKEPWFRKFPRLPHGIPSEDSRVFAALDPEVFERCFLSWIKALAGSSKGKLIPIDGKTPRHSFDRAHGQAALHEKVKLVLDHSIVTPHPDCALDFHEEVDGGHGRVEIRRARVTPAVDWFEDRERWPGLRSFAAVEGERDVGKKVTCERGSFISSLEGTAAIARAVRTLWSVENNPHWPLDVAFHED